MRNRHWVEVWLDGEWVMVPLREARVPGTVQRSLMADCVVLLVRQEKNWLVTEKRPLLDRAGPAC